MADDYWSVTLTYCSLEQDGYWDCTVREYSGKATRELARWHGYGQPNWNDVRNMRKLNDTIIAAAFIALPGIQEVLWSEIDEEHDPSVSTD